MRSQAQPPALEHGERRKFGTQTVSISLLVGRQATDRRIADGIHSHGRPGALLPEPSNHNGCWRPHWSYPRSLLQDPHLFILTKYRSVSRHGSVGESKNVQGRLRTRAPHWNPNLDSGELLGRYVLFSQLRACCDTFSLLKGKIIYLLERTRLSE